MARAELTPFVVGAVGRGARWMSCRHAASRRRSAVCLVRHESTGCTGMWGFCFAKSEHSDNTRRYSECEDSEHSREARRVAVIWPAWIDSIEWGRATLWRHQLTYFVGTNRKRTGTLMDVSALWGANFWINGPKVIKLAQTTVHLPLTSASNPNRTGSQMFESRFCKVAPFSFETSLSAEHPTNGQVQSHRLHRRVP